MNPTSNFQIVTLIINKRNKPSNGKASSKILGNWYINWGPVVVVLVAYKEEFNTEPFQKRRATLSDYLRIRSIV